MFYWLLRRVGRQKKWGRPLPFNPLRKNLSTQRYDIIFSLPNIFCFSLKNSELKRIKVEGNGII